MKILQFFYQPLSTNVELAVCCVIELESITKHLITGPTGGSEFCFPSANSEGLEETKLTVFLGKGTSLEVLIVDI